MLYCYILFVSFFVLKFIFIEYCTVCAYTIFNDDSIIVLVPNIINDISKLAVLNIHVLFYTYLHYYNYNQ